MGFEGESLLDEPIAFDWHWSQPGRWRRLKLSLAAVATCLYLPFFWLPGQLATESLGVLPSIGAFFVSPGAFALFFLPDTAVGTNRPLCFTIMAIATLLLVVGLTWLGMQGWRARVGAALVALSVSLPTSMLMWAASGE